MENHEKRLENYLKSLNSAISKENAKLLQAFAEKVRALPNEPGAYRILTILTRLKTVSLIVDKPLDSLTEKDLIKINTAMRDRGLKSAEYYRKVLKQFLRLTDKKRFIDLIDSDYLKSPSTKNGKAKLVNPDEFWNEKQIADYIDEAKKNSLRQTAWAGLWLSSGCRPHELLALKKNNVFFENNLLTIRVIDGKTGSRTIFLRTNEGLAAWGLAEPYLKTLSENAPLFPGCYANYEKIHKRICARIKIPEGNSRKLYIARKMALTGFYNRLGLVEASSMAGHVPGSNSMKHYVAMNESQLKQGMARLELKECPNLSCRHVNEPGNIQCFKCKSPLDKNAYAAILENAQKNKVQLEERVHFLENKISDFTAIMQELSKYTKNQKRELEKMLVARK